MAYMGKFVPTNKEKYRGDWSKITYRSSWEKFVMEMLDKNPEIVEWASETVVIPYFSNADGKKRRYFMDFYLKTKTGQIYLWEVKPEKETRPPVAPSQLTVAKKKRYISEIYTFSVNLDKWKAAHNLCRKKGWGFKIISESALKQMGFKGIYD